jgi:twitching motility protein PilT
MIGTPGVRNVIREHKTHQIQTQIQTGAQYGMHTMDQSLKKLVLSGKVRYAEALVHVKNPDSFRDIPDNIKEDGMVE